MSPFLCFPYGDRGKTWVLLFFQHTKLKLFQPLNPLFFLTEDDVALYHVVFDDGDEQDFSEHELQMGIELYNLEGLTQEEKAKGKSKSTKPTSTSTTTSSNSSTKKATESVSPATKKVKTEPAPSKATTKSNSIAAVLAADRAKQATATKSTVKTATSTTPAKGKDKGKGKGKTGAKNSSSAKKSTAELLEEVGEEEGADDPVWIMKHDSVFKRVAQHFLTSGGAKKQVYEIFGGTILLRFRIF